MNPEINALFNPSKGTGFNSGTQQNYGDLFQSVSKWIPGG